MNKIGYIATYLIITAFGVVYNGYALTALWDWFIVSTFKLESLSLIQAVGVALTVGYLTKGIPSKDPDYKDKSQSDKIQEYLLTLALKPTVCMFFGYIYFQFM